MKKIKWIIYFALIMSSLLYLGGCSKDEVVASKQEESKITIEYQTGDIIVDKNLENKTKGNLISDSKEAYDIAYIILSKNHNMNDYKKAFVTHDENRGLWKVEFSQDSDIVGGGVEIILDEKDARVLSVFGTE